VILDPSRVDELRVEVQRIVERRGLASCQYAIAHQNEVLVNEVVGDATPDARYHVFSVTKIVAAALVWQLVGQGMLDYTSPVARWWPEFAQGGKQDITLMHLLGHTAGIPTAAVTADAWEDRERRVTQMADWTLEWKPGTRFEYHPLSAHWVLAELIARTTGLDHRLAFRDRLLDPLGLDRFEVGVPQHRQGDVLPLVETGRLPTLEEFAEVLDPALVEAGAALLPTVPVAPADDPVLGPLSAPLGLAAGVPGGGGVSDAASVALFYQGLLVDRAGLWDPRALQYATSVVVNRHPTGLGVPVMRGLGTEMSGQGTRAERRQRLGSGYTSPAAFGHAGAGGQIAWADPTTGLSFAFLTNGWDHHVLEVARRERLINEAVTRCVVS
jgi:CubicO group peptidase (beta-lactamase class C family)